MTVTASTRKAGPYAGNGVATSFPFYFKVFDKTGIQVVLTDANGAATTLVLDSDYSVALSTDQDAAPGGTITYPILGSPMAAGLTLTAIGGTTYDQATDITNAGRFLPQVIENALDKVTILIQQLKEVSDRTLQAAIGTTVQLLFPAPSSGKFLRWRTDLTGLENAEAGTDSMALQGQLADATLSNRGAGMLGYGSSLAYTNGTIGAKLNQVLSVKDMPFNAKGDGTTDDTAAVQAAFTAAALAGRAVYFPAGTYKLTARLTASGNLSIWGESRGTTKLYWPSTAPTSGIGITLNSVAGFSQTCDLSNVSLVTGSTVAAGEAFTVTGVTATASDRVSPRVVVRDVTVRGVTNPSIDGWASALRFINCTNVVVDSVAVFGKVSGAGEPNYDSNYCIIYDTSNGATPHAVALTICNSFLNYAKIGIYCSDFEGAMICENQIVGVNTGISVTGPAHYPHAAIMNNHINASLLGVQVTQMYEVLIHDNLIYKQLDDVSTGAGIDIFGSAAYFSILGNTFENLNNVVGMNAVIVSSGSRGLIDNNIFRRCNNQPGTVPGTGIWLTAGSSECIVGTNLFAETTNQIIDSGTLNNVKQSGVSGGVDAWWTTDTDGRTRQWGSVVVTLNGSGFGTITLPKTYRSGHESAIVCNGDSSVQGDKVFSRAALGIGAISFAVIPNPGAVVVRVDFVSHGV